MISQMDVTDLNIDGISRKLFTFTFTFNMVGLVIAASGHFPYATRYAGSIAMGNFNFSVLMRNEVFGRFLYLFVNTLFAKVCQLITPMYSRRANSIYPVDSFVVPSGMHFRSPTSWRHPQWLCPFRYCMAHVQSCA